MHLILNLDRPVMPAPLAILCCILNFLIPGLGTMISGCSVCCCTKNETLDESETDEMRCSLVKEGCKQLLCSVFLTSWCISCYYGVMFLSDSFGIDLDSANAGTNKVGHRDTERTAETTEHPENGNDTNVPSAIITQP